MLGEASGSETVENKYVKFENFSMIHINQHLENSRNR